MIDTRKRGRPQVASEPIQVRIEATLIAALDDARRNETDMPTRPEIIRRLLTEILKDKGYLRQ